VLIEPVERTWEPTGAQPGGEAPPGAPIGPWAPHVEQTVKHSAYWEQWRELWRSVPSMVPGLWIRRRETGLEPGSTALPHPL
jgi:hypothetical protein